MSKISKKTVFFSQNLDFAWYFMVFLVRTSYTAADTLTAGLVVRPCTSTYDPEQENTIAGPAGGTRAMPLPLPLSDAVARNVLKHAGAAHRQRFCR